MVVTMMAVLRVSTLMEMRVRRMVLNGFRVVRRQSMVVTMMMIMAMAMVSVSERKDPHQVDDKSKAADGKKLAKLFDFTTACQSLCRLENDFDTDKPNPMVSDGSLNLTRVSYIKKMPLAKPARVSTLPNP